jgi:hypothetical protein
MNGRRGSLQQPKANLGERAQKRILRRPAAKTLSYGIHPDIPGDPIDAVPATQNRIVVFELPQAAFGPLFEFDRGRLFESLDKFHQIAFIAGARRQDVNVVGHDAIRVNKKGASDGMFPKGFNQPAGDARIGTETAAPIETHRHEIRITAKISRGGQSDVFSVRSSRRGHVATGKQLAALKTAALRLNLTATLYMRKMPNFVSGMGALMAAERPSARTWRVCAGSMMPSSQRRAVA